VSRDASGPAEGAAAERHAEFLSRWSRRKRAARAGRDPDRVAPDPGERDSAATVPAEGRAEVAAGVRAAVAPGMPARRDEQPASEALAEADLPPLESLGEDSDYSAFLAPGVSDGLRRAALRKLFSSAAFNRLDGLDDYDEDYRAAAALFELAGASGREASPGPPAGPSAEPLEAPPAGERAAEPAAETASEPPAPGAREARPGTPAQELPAPARENGKDDEGGEDGGRA